MNYESKFIHFYISNYIYYQNENSKINYNNIKNKTFQIC